MTNKLLVDQRTETCNAVSAKWVVSSIFFCFCLKSSWSVLPWTPPSLSYSCVESHCWCVHHSSRCSKATGGSHFIRAVIWTAGESLDLTASRGDRREDLVERAEDGTKFQERRSQKESASRMTPVTLALTFSLLSMWTLTSAVQFEEKGKSSQTPA